MSYTRTITSNGNSISQEGGQSFNQQLDDLQEQIEEGGGGSITDLGTSSGTANALAGASLVDTATTFTAGRLYRIRTNAANSGAATCSINGGTGVAMKKSPSSAALASGDIADATELLLYYDGTNLQVLSGLTVSATNSWAGVSRKKSTTQSISATTETKIVFQTQIITDSGVTVTSDTDFALGSTQKWEIKATVNHQPGAAGAMWVRIYSGSTLIREKRMDSGDNGTIDQIVIYEGAFTSGDSVSVRFYGNQATTILAETTLQITPRGI